MKFSKTRKKKMNSSNPSYQSMRCIIRWRNRFINSIRIFFICFKMFIMQRKQRRNSWDEIKRMGSENWRLRLRLRLNYNVYMLARQLCVFDDKTDLKSKWVKKLILWFCCPNYLIYFWRYRSVMLCCRTICLMISDCVTS